MKPFYSTKLLILIAILFGSCPGAFAQTITSYTYTGAVQYYTVPAGCTTISIDMAGAQGGGSEYLNGGAGGRLQCVLAVTPLQVYNIYVGSVGSGTGNDGGTLGTNGTGYVGGNGSSFGGGGGGCSEIQFGGSRILVAGAGGGGSWDCTSDHGGLGGNATGSNGLVCGSYNSSECGAGGSQTAGGVAASGGGASNGAYGSGGNGGGSTSWEGGGGCGYYGGGGGSNYGSGGGGSSYPIASGGSISGLILTQGYWNTGSGFIKIQAVVPTVTPSVSSLSFGPVVVGSVSATPLSFTVTGVSLTSSPLNVTIPPGFEISVGSPTGPWVTGSTTIPVSIPTLSVTPIYVNFMPAAYSSYSNNIVFSSAGLFAPVNVAVSGTGVYPCSGTPTPGTITASPTLAGPTTPISLAVTGASSGPGISYQWQVSNFPSSGYMNVSGANSSTFTYTGITATSYFICLVTCSSSGLSSSGAAAMVTDTVTLPNCGGVPLSGTATSDVNSACNPFVAHLMYTPTIAHAGFAYNWEMSTTGAGGTYTPIVGAVYPYYTASVTGTVWIRERVRCVYGGLTNTSPIVQLTQNAPPSSIGGSPNICMPSSTLFTATPTGGTWTSSNTAIANIVPTSGIATGITPGAATITYTLSTGCMSTLPVGVNTGAASVSGSSNVCISGTTTLSDASPLGTWSSSNPSIATVNASTGLVTGVGAGAVNILYTLPTSCSATEPMNVHPLPGAITGTPNVCIGSTRILSDVTSGGYWTSSNPFAASVGATSGIVTGFTSGSATILYKLPTGCSVSQAFTVNPSPSSISGGGVVCVGQSTTLTDVGGGTWGTSDPSIATVNSSTGVVTGVAAGSPYISYFLPVTGCWVTDNITVNNLPQVNAVTETDGGGYCPGSTGVHVGLNGSLSGIEYYLYDVTSSTPIDSLPGSSSGLDFGLYTVGIYTVSATNTTTGCSSNMNGKDSIFVYTPPTAYNVVGGGNYCAGGTGVEITTDGSDLGVNYQLYNSSGPVGASVIGTGSPISFGYFTIAGFYYAVATSAATLCTTNLGGGANVYISRNPLVFNLSSGGSYCSGSTCIDLTLDNSSGGVNYNLYVNGIMSTIPAYSGVAGLLDFGPQCLPGNYTVVATDITNGCTATMNGVATIIENPVPTVYDVTGGGSYCAGGIGVHVGTNFSISGTSYVLTNSSTGVVDTVGGSNSGLDFGLQTNAGTYSVLGFIGATGCSSNMSGSVTVNVNSLPVAEPVSAGSSYCDGGTGVDVNVGASQPGINYQLYRNGLSVGGSLPGSSLGGMVDFGNQVVAGTYTIAGIDPMTGCNAMMAGSSVISINPLPLVYNIGGGGSFCAGGAGVPVTISNSAVGINYNILVGGVSTGAVAMGMGGSMSLGLQTTAGVYTIEAVDAFSGCSINMNGSVVVTVNPLPAAYAVTGGGNYCQGAAGLAVGLGLSNTGINYQLQNDGVNVGSYLLGSGRSLNFGIKTDTGTYSVIATNATTGCVNTMANTVPVNEIMLPTVFTVSGGGVFCAGGSGVPVGLSGSDVSGVTYELYNGTTPVTSMTATGGSINFGSQVNSGNYTVVATTTIGGCTDNMASSVNVTANAAPSVYALTGGGNYCAGGTGVHVYLSGSTTFVDYTVYTSSMSAPIGTYAGTGRPLDIVAMVDTGNYTIVATNVTTGCTDTMSGMVAVSTTPVVTPAVTITGTNNVCQGIAANFTANPVNGGTSPLYEWKVNSAVVGYGSTYSYVPGNGDNVSVFLTSDAPCASVAVVSSAEIMSVTDNVTPSVTISSDQGSKVCPGTAVNYAANPVSGGSSPTYVWVLNGVNVGTSSTYSHTPVTSDVVFCTLSSSMSCLTTSSPVLSNDIATIVDAPVLPVFTLSANPSTVIANGQALTMSASVSNLPSNAVSYQWKLNGVMIPGATNASYMSVTFNDNDVICCDITSHNECGTSNVAEECNTVIVHANLGVGQVNSGNSNLSLVPNPNNGSFVVKGNLANIIDQEVVLEVTNVLGQVVYTNKVMAKNGMINEQVQLNNSIANGMYLLNVRAGADNSVVHFVIEQ